MTLSFESQIGDAWDRSDEFNQKVSSGFQWRISGYSFYNYPIAIGFEIHKPHKSFKMEINDGDKILYGNENRMYFNILFGF